MGIACEENKICNSGGGKNKQKMLPSGRVQRVIYCLRDLPIAKSMCAALMIDRICLVSSSLEYQVLMLEYTGCHVLAAVIAMYVGLQLPWI